MWVISNTFMILLITAGILSFAVAESEILISRNESFHEIPELNNFTKLVESQTLREKCEKVGGQTVYNVMKERMEYFDNCTESVVTNSHLFEDLRAASTNEWETLFNNFCNTIPPLGQCVKHFVYAVEPCLVEEERIRVAMRQNAMISLFEFICHDNVTTRWFPFFATGGLENCLSPQKTDIVNCFKNVRDSYSDFDQQKLSSHDSGLRECYDMEELQNCIVNATQRCENPEHANTIDSFFFAYINATSCQTNLTGNTSPATEISIPDISNENETSVSWLRERCERNAGPEAYDNLEETVEIVSKSFNLLFNSSQVGAELTAAGSNVRFEALFKKYCRRVPIYHELENYAVGSLRPCLEPEEQKWIDFVQKISTSFLDASCSEEGARLTTFFATGGAECIGHNLYAILNCASQSFDNYLPKNSSGVGELGIVPVMESGKFCTDLAQFQDCSVRVLATCENRTTSDLFNSLINYVSHEIPCGKWLGRNETASPETLNCTTIAPERILSSEDQLRNQSDIELFTGLVDSSDLNVTNEVIEIYLREKCERNGGPTAYDAVAVIPGYISNAFQSFVEYMMGNFSGTAEGYGPSGEGNIFKFYCAKVPTLEGSIKHVESSIKPCLDSEDREDLEAIVNITTAIIDFTCENDGAHLAELFSPGSLQCFGFKNQDVEKCVSQINHTDTNTSHGTSIEDCHEIVNAQDCIVNVLKECEDQSAANIIKSLIDRIIAVTPCNNLLNTLTLPIKNYVRGLNVTYATNGAASTHIPTF